MRTVNAHVSCLACGKEMDYYLRPTKAPYKYCSNACWMSIKNKTIPTKGFTGGHHTQEAKNRISNFMSQRILSQEHKDKIAKAHIGKPSWSKGKKIGFGNFKGHKHSLETKVKMSQCQTKRYEGHISREELRNYIRRNYLYRQWRSDVFFRDNFTCQECGVRSGNGKAVYLEAHHCRISFSEIMNKYKITTIEEAVLCPELWDINNGLTLCVPCHDKTKEGRPCDRK
jgi:hypothetical protein